MLCLHLHYPAVKWNRREAFITEKICFLKVRVIALLPSGSVNQGHSLVGLVRGVTG